MSLPEFKRLYDAWGNYVFSLAYRLTGRRADAEDLTQEAFLRAYRFQKDFKGGSVKGWLYRIVTNVFYSELEKGKRRPLLLEDDDLMRKADRAVPGPEEEASRNEAHAVVHRLVASLPPDYRIAVILADIEGLSYQEIAGILNVPIGTVRSRIARGRSILKEKLIQENVLERRGV